MSLFNRVKYTKLNRRGYEVVLPTDVYNELREQGYCVNLILGKNHTSEPYKSVQLVRDGKYCGTLKTAMGVKGFKNGNACDFRISNLIEE